MTKIKWLSIIRVSGLLLILVYHFFNEALPGGFIGVDVFFTLSGFLVTVSIVEEFRNSGKFALFSFYKRRFMRLYPPLVICILFTLPFTFLLFADFIVNIGRQTAAALGFVTNYFEIMNGGSYEAQLLPHLFIHTWFLAVEVHLYLVWALLCAIIIFMIIKFYHKSDGASFVFLRALLTTVSLTGAVFSYLRMQVMYSAHTADPSAAYFDTAAHAFPFLLGACAGSIFTGKINTNKTESPSVLKYFAIGGMVVCTGAFVPLARILQFSESAAYRYGFLAASLLTVSIIYAAIVLHKSAINTDEPRALTTAASLTYHVYLFHWPLYIVFSYAVISRNFIFWNNTFAAVVSMMFSIVFSCFVFFCLEPSFHRKLPLAKINSTALRRSLYAGFFLIVVAIVVLNGFVFARALELTSLEEQLNTGYMYQDADKIKQLAQLTKAINDQPVIQSGRIPAASYLQNRALLSGVSIIGDSVALDAFMKIKEAIPNSYVNAASSREIWQGYDLIMELQENNSLREYLVVALGTNQNINANEFIDKIIEDIRPGIRLILVTPYNGAANEYWSIYQTMQYMRTLPAIHPFVTVADWAALIEKQSQLLGSDNVHIGGNTAAIALYTDCIVDAVNTASAKPPKS